MLITDLEKYGNRWRIQNFEKQQRYLLAFVFCAAWQVSAVVELALEELNSEYGEYYVEKHVDNNDVFDVFQRVDHAVEHCLKLRHAVDGLERA